MGKKIRAHVEESFSDFFEVWLVQLEEYVQQFYDPSSPSKDHMITITNEAELRILLSKLTTHYKQYYTVKWAYAHQDVLPFFSPVWLSPFENAYTWVTGWKPSMAFKIIMASSSSSSTPNLAAAALSEHQANKIEELRRKIKLGEEKVDREMERQQVAMADRRMVELSRLESRRRNGEILPLLGNGNGNVESLVEVAMKTLLLGLERTMKTADCIRLKTLKGILEVLNPLQSLHFLTSFAMIQIQLRQWGKIKNNDK